MMLLNKKRAFTLVELLVVIAIIGLIASLSVIALGNARQKSRDSKRVSDIKQVQTALELFFSDQGRYPTAAEWASGSLYATGTMGTSTYMDRLPTAQTGGTCDNNYTYTPNSTGDNYILGFCLESQTGSLSKGLNFANAAAVSSKDPDMIAWVGLGISNGLTDISNSGNNGTGYGSIIIGADTNQKNESSGATIFDGVDDYIKITDKTNQRTTVFTVMAWVKSTDNSALLQQGIVSKANLGGYEYGWILRKNPDNKFYFSTNNNHYTRTDVLTYSNLSYIDNAWHHVVGVRQSNGTNYIYIDGVRQTASKVGSTINLDTSPQPIVIGSAYGDYPIHPTYLEPFKGSIADVRIYNRALSDLEIKVIYDSTK